MAHFPTYEMQYKVYRWTGMAKNDFESRTKKILYGSYDIMLTSSYVIFQFTFGYSLMVIATSLSFEAVLSNAGTFLMCLGVLTKRLFVLGKKQRVKDLYLRIKKDFENPAIKAIKEADIIIHEYDQFYKLINGFLYTLGICTTIVFSSPAYVNFPKELPFPVPFQEYLSQTQFVVLLLWQTILIWVASINFLAYDSLVWGFLMLIATRMRLVAKMCENFTDSYPSIDFKKYIPEFQGYPKQSGEENKATKKYHTYDEYGKYDDKIVADTVKFLKESIVYYQEITEEMGTVEKLFSNPLLLHMVGGAILVGIMIVFVLIGGLQTRLGFQTFLFFFCSITDLFNFSYYGTKVNEAKDILAAAVYGCPWFEGDAQTGKLFLNMMSMMRNKMQYTAGGFVAINFETYLSLMKLSYNLLAVLN